MKSRKQYTTIFPLMIIYTWRWHHVIRVEKEKDDILSISDFISESPFS